MERKKGRSGSNRMILIHSNVSNQMMMLIHSNVSKFFKNNTLTRCTVLQTVVVWTSVVTVRMRRFFLKEIEITSICVFKKVKNIKKKKNIHLQDFFHLEKNITVTFKISCRPNFQDEYVLMFAGMFLGYFEQFPSDLNFSHI